MNRGQEGIPFFRRPRSTEQHYNGGAQWDPGTYQGTMPLSALSGRGHYTKVYPATRFQSETWDHDGRYDLCQNWEMKSCGKRPRGGLPKGRSDRRLPYDLLSTRVPTPLPTCLSRSCHGVCSQCSPPGNTAGALWHRCPPTFSTVRRDFPGAMTAKREFTCLYQNL